jgi:hypothetical protein
MTEPWSLEDVFALCDNVATPIDRKLRLRFEQSWLEVYAQRVKEEHGARVYGEYKWHAFSFGYTWALRGYSALERYRALSTPEFVVMHEDLGVPGYVCRGGILPDLTELADDYYVFPIGLEWTMVFTHEQPAFGPFFSCLLLP